MVDTIFKIYLSHPQICNKNYLSLATEIQAYLIDWEKMYELPKSTLFIPIQYKWLLDIAITQKFITNKQVEDVYKEVLKSSDLLVAFGDWTTNVNIESDIMFARKYDVPVYTMPRMCPEAIEALRMAIILISERS